VRLGGTGASVDATEEALIVVLLIVAYLAVVLSLRRAGRLGPERSLSLFGPALMMKTQRGRGWLDRVGRFRRFWSVAGDLGVLLAAVAMVLIVGLLIWEGLLATQIPASAAPAPQTALGIPGINPIIPIGYGLVALVVGIVLHELAHGIVARSQGVGVKSLGILWFVIPVGAFVEQDEEGMNRAPRRRRSRIAAAGVLANFALTVVFFAAVAGVVSATVQPNATGVGVAYVVDHSPAANLSMAAGDIITSVNGTPTPDNVALFNALANTTPNESIAISYYSASAQHLVTTRVVLATSQYEAGRGFLGVGLAFLTPTGLRQEFTWPLGNPDGPLVGATTWIVLPLAGLQPVGGATMSYFHLVGPLAGLGPDGFWVLVNLLFWLSWMNLLLGLSNALPLIPLDGGLLFRDFSAGLLSRLRRGWDAARLDAVAGRLTVAASVMVIFLIVWEFVAPRL
jgi:membrane-associated protease RseP (regulator of RpoE activity)